MPDRHRKAKPCAGKAQCTLQSGRTQNISGNTPPKSNAHPSGSFDIESTWQVFWLTPVPKPSRPLRISGWDVRNLRGASQQRDCPGFAPDSLFISSPARGTENQIWGQR